MINREELTSFVFDILGDLVSPKDINIVENRGELSVVILRRSVPKELIFDDWRRNVIGTKFESVSIFC